MINNWRCQLATKPSWPAYYQWANKDGTAPRLPRRNPKQSTSIYFTVLLHNTLSQSHRLPVYKKLQIICTYNATPDPLQFIRRDPQMEIMIQCIYCSQLSPPWPPPQPNSNSLHTYKKVAHENKQPTEQQSNDLTKMHDIHVCPSCPYIQPYNTHNSLNRHINTHHLHQQTKTNIELRTDTFRSAEDKKTWQQTLAFLNHLNIKPPPIQINHLLS